MKTQLNLLYYILLIGLLAVGVLSTSCRKDDVDSSPDITLSFSTDSVKFDTVFNTVGSATQLLKVYNTRNSFVNISRIRLINDANESYRINVDGVSGTEFTDVEIGPEDSLFIFIEVTVTPDQDALYPFVEGEIDFQTNGNQQNVKLTAWGWDAIFYTPTVFPTNGLPDFTVIDTVNQNATVTWTSEKPIVVYGYLVVDSLQTLNIEPGTEVFFHEGAGLWVYRDGNIQAIGTAEEPIVFQGDRLEPFYEEQPGQWDRIWINEGSTNNRFTHCTIKNNFIGIQAETLPFSYNIDAPISSNTLELNRVNIRNNSIAGLFTRNYRIDATSSLFSAGGQHSLAGTGGGKYEFDQCTFANNWRFGIRQSPAVFLTNLTQVDANTVQVRVIESSTFRNCIITGNNLNELGLDFETEGGVSIDLKFRTTLITAEEDVIEPYLNDDNEFFADSTFVNLDPGFMNFSEGDFRLTENSNAIGRGQNYTGLPASDITEFPFANPRPLGCYEFMPE